MTDALGRTADFSNAIIIMTSNLGVREAEGNLGFLAEQDRSSTYTKAAEKFFRPEFFNRLDRVIPFKKLSRDELATIARRLVNEVLAREGFGQRKCVLNVSSDALDRVIAAGYNPSLHARAMKRAVEHELTQPAAGKLAELSPDELTVVTVKSGDRGLLISIQAPGWANKVAVEERAAFPTAERLSVAWAVLDRIDDELAPAAQGVRQRGQSVSEHERYFALKELSDEIGDLLNDYEGRLEDNKLSKYEARQPDAVGRKARYRAIKVRSSGDNETGSQPFRSLSSAESMQQALREMFDAAEPLPDEAELFEVENKIGLLRLMASAPPTTNRFICGFGGSRKTCRVHPPRRWRVTTQRRGRPNWAWRYRCPNTNATSGLK